MNEFKKVESMLYNYKNTKAEINILKRDLEILENDYKGTSAISYDEKTQLTNAFNSAVENEVIRRAERIQQLRNKIRLKEIEIENIDDALETLNPDDKLFVVERYFNKRSNKYVASLLNIVEQTACTYKNRIVNLLIPLLGDS